MQWFAIRTIFRHERIGSGRGVFEEKVSLYRASDVAEAHSRAANDTKRYLEMNANFVQVGGYSAFMLGHGETDLDGREVWSHLSEGPADTAEFFRAKYEKFDLGAD